MLTKFLKSRRQGLSTRTIEFYQFCLEPFVSSYNLTSEGINKFLTDLKCGNAKHAYYRAIRVFSNWVTREGYIKENPIRRVDSPKCTEVILPSLSIEQVNHLMDEADTIRDKCIISLFADSGMRLNELCCIKLEDINWSNNTVVIWGKGDKQRKAPFTPRTAKLLRQWISQNGNGCNIWHLKPWGIVAMLSRLREKTGLPCNPHTFRRTFASNLHRAGVDIEHIMRLGGWSSLDMVITYTKSVKFEDSLKIYQSVQNY